MQARAVVDDGELGGGSAQPSVQGRGAFHGHDGGVEACGRAGLFHFLAEVAEHLGVLLHVAGLPRQFDVFQVGLFREVYAFEIAVGHGVDAVVAVFDAYLELCMACGFLGRGDVVGPVGRTHVLDGEIGDFTCFRERAVGGVVDDYPQAFYGFDGVAGCPAAVEGGRESFEVHAHG